MVHDSGTPALIGHAGEIAQRERTPRRPWNHNIHYHDLVLRSVPANCRLALDVGCGTGVLARRLADRSEKVIGIDIDPKILSQARSFPNPESRIQFVEGDVMTYRLPVRSFDFIAAVATLHHLPLRRALWRFHDLLRPGGVVAVIGLYRAQTLVDFAVDAAAFPANWLLRGLYGYFEPPTRKQNAQETLGEIRSTCKALLPGSEIKRLLLFRYVLIWRKP
jgi:SAM-dependent methyltransferase